MLRRALIPVLALLLAPAAAGGAGPTAQASKACNIDGKQRGFGATYVTSLSAKKTSCSKGEGVVRGFHACRQERNSDSCSSKVSGYKCTQTKLATSPVQYDARVKCRKGGRRVVHVYTQNT